MFALAPRAEKRLDDFPTGFDHVSPLEESLIPIHAIVNKTLVAGCAAVTEVVCVRESQVRSIKLEPCSRDLHAEAELNAFVGLNPKYELIGQEVLR